MICTNAVLDGLGDRLRSIPGLRVYDYLADDVAVPAAVCTIDSVTYDMTMGRGTDSGKFSVIVVVNQADVRTARDELDQYLAGSGLHSVKAAIEWDRTLGGGVESVRVTGAEVVAIPIAGVEYLAARFTVDVIA